MGRESLSRNAMLSRLDDDSGKATSAVIGLAVGALVVAGAFGNRLDLGIDVKQKPTPHSSMETVIKELKNMPLPQFVRTTMLANGVMDTAVTLEVLSKEVKFPNSTRNTAVKDVLVNANTSGDGLDSYEFIDGDIDPKTQQPNVTANVYVSRIAFDVHIMDDFAYVEPSTVEGQPDTIKQSSIVTNEGAKTAAFNGITEFSTNNLAALCSVAARLVGSNGEKCDKIAFVRNNNAVITAAASALTRREIIEDAVKCMSTLDEEYRDQIKAAIIEMVASQRGLTIEQAARLTTVKFVDDNSNETDAPFNYHHTTYDKDPNLAHIESNYGQKIEDLVTTTCVNKVYQDATIPTATPTQSPSAIPTLTLSAAPSAEATSSQEPTTTPTSTDSSPSPSSGSVIEASNQFATGNVTNVNQRQG